MITAVAWVDLKAVIETYSLTESEQEIRSISQVTVAKDLTVSQQTPQSLGDLIAEVTSSCVLQIR